jgi:hypothetical protein
MRCCTQPKRTMPPLSNPAAPTDAHPAPHKMRRLHNAGRTLKLLASLFVLAFLCAYARIALRYETPHPQTTAAIAHPSPYTFFAPTHSRTTHRRQSFFRPVHQTKHRARRSHPYYLAGLRRLHRLFSQLLVVRS